jgi:hypothetical protein
MSSEVSLEGTRLSEPDGGSFCFDGWHWDNEYERLAVKGVIEGIENTLRHDPPWVHIAAADADVRLDFSLDGLGKDGLSGPAWRFSLYGVCAANADGWDEEDRQQLIKALRTVAERLERKA